MHATHTIFDTTMLHSFIWILSMCVIWIIIDVIFCVVADTSTAAVSFASEFSFMPYSANLTHFPVYDFVEIDETNLNYAIRTNYPKYSNSQNHNHHNSHQHERKTNRWNVHHLNHGESHRYQHKINRGGGSSGSGSERNEWIRHATEMRTKKIRPKPRQRHEKRWHRNHRQFFGNDDHISSKLHADLEIKMSRMLDAANNTIPIHWPVKKEAIVVGDIILGGLMMVHSREDTMMCGPIMPQGGIQALEAMLYTLDKINEDSVLLPNFTIGAHILDDCDRDSYGLEMAVDFIKGMSIKIKQSNLDNTDMFLH